MTTVVAVVIPCFCVKDHILDVLTRLGPEVTQVGTWWMMRARRTAVILSERCQDPRVKVLRHTVNRGVGGAVMTGYTEALLNGADIVVKVDGDGQMDPCLIPLLSPRSSR